MLASNILGASSVPNAYCRVTTSTLYSEHEYLFSRRVAVPGRKHEGGLDAALQRRTECRKSDELTVGETRWASVGRYRADNSQ